MLLPGDHLPHFQTKDLCGNKINSNDFIGYWSIFYINSIISDSNSTNHCKELEELKSNLSIFKVNVILISDCSKHSQIKWVMDNKINITTISDPKIEIIRSMGAWKPVANNGKTYMSVKNTILLVDPHLTVRSIKETSESSIIATILYMLRSNGIGIPFNKKMEINEEIKEQQAVNLTEDDCVVFE